MNAPTADRLSFESRYDKLPVLVFELLKRLLLTDRLSFESRYDFSRHGLPRWSAQQPTFISIVQTSSSTESFIKTFAFVERFGVH